MSLFNATRGNGKYDKQGGRLMASGGNTKAFAVLLLETI